MLHFVLVVTNCNRVSYYIFAYQTLTVVKPQPSKLIVASKTLTLCFMTSVRTVTQDLLNSKGLNCLVIMTSNNISSPIEFTCQFTKQAMRDRMNRSYRVLVQTLTIPCTLQFPICSLDDILMVKITRARSKGRSPMMLHTYKS